MSIALNFVIFLSLFSSGHSYGKSKLIRTVSLERKQIEQLAKKSNLNATEWIEFVDGIDKKCDSEVDVKKEKLCSLYYEIYKIADLFRETNPSADECQAYLVTAEDLSQDNTTRNHLKLIVGKLCPSY